MKHKTNNKGFTLVLTLIVMSIALSIGLGVYGIILREIQLSGLGRESEIAFYAADSGIECALYWDIHEGPLSTTSPTTIFCFGKNTQVVFGSSPSIIASFKFGLDNGACVKVNINKNNSAATIVDSYGYNVDCDSSFPRKVERGVRIIY